MTRLLLALAAVSSTKPFIASKLSLLVMSKVSSAPIALVSPAYPRKYDRVIDRKLSWPA